MKIKLKIWPPGDNTFEHYLPSVTAQPARPLPVIRFDFDCFEFLTPFLITTVSADQCHVHRWSSSFFCHHYLVCTLYNCFYSLGLGFDILSVWFQLDLYKLIFLKPMYSNKLFIVT